jgi:hypothetical protein
MIFDYTAVAKRTGIPDETLARLCHLVREEFPTDDMLFELHVLRALLAVERGQVRLDELVKPAQAAS